METYKCSICGYVYDPAEGDLSAGIEPGVNFIDLPADYICPICGAGKDEFIVNS
jgi:Rubredoxin